MENKILIILSIVIIILFFLLVYYRNKANRIYSESDKLLDQILENSYINHTISCIVITIYDNIKNCILLIYNNKFANSN